MSRAAPPWPARPRWRPRQSQHRCCETALHRISMATKNITITLPARRLSPHPTRSPRSGPRRGLWSLVHLVGVVVDPGEHANGLGHPEVVGEGGHVEVVTHLVTGPPARRSRRATMRLRYRASLSPSAPPGGASPGGVDGPGGRVATARGRRRKLSREPRYDLFQSQPAPQPSDVAPRSHPPARRAISRDATAGGVVGLAWWALIESVFARGFGLIAILLALIFGGVTELTGFCRSAWRRLPAAWR